MKHGTKTSALIVICIMGIIAISCQWMVYSLVSQIPAMPSKIDKDVVIVFVAQIGGLATFGGTAIGILGGVLGSTERVPPANQVEVINDQTNPVPTLEDKTNG